MEALVSELTKKNFKNWKALFQPFMKERVVDKAKTSENGLSSFLMGLYHEEGFCVEKDYQLALEYYHKGANQRDPLCLYKLYEIHSAKNFYGVQPDQELASLYLIWAISYLLPVYGSYMCLDLDLELQTYYKNIIKQDKTSIYNLIDQFEDDIFAHDKDLIKCFFDFFVDYLCPGIGFNVQERYNKMLDELIDLAEKGNAKFPALFLFKIVLWDFQNVSDRQHKKVLNLLEKCHTKTFLFNNIKTVFEYLNIIHEKHAVFSKFLRFDGIEIFWQIQYNTNPDDPLRKEDACYYIAKTLFDHLSLIENNVTRFISMDLMAKCHEDGVGIEQDYKKALEIIENSRNFTGFVEEDFPYLRVAKLYHKLGDEPASIKCYEKYIGYSYSKRDLPIKFFRQGRYFECYKKDFPAAMEKYINGLISPTEFYTFQLELYAQKCKRRIIKLLQTQPELSHQFKPQLHDINFNFISK